MALKSVQVLTMSKDSSIILKKTRYSFLRLKFHSLFWIFLIDAWTSLLSGANRSSIDSVRTPAKFVLVQEVITLRIVTFRSIRKVYQLPSDKEFVRLCSMRSRQGVRRTASLNQERTTCHHSLALPLLQPQLHLGLWRFNLETSQLINRGS